MDTLHRILLGGALLVGGVGQIIWGLVFWDTPLFIHHWTLGLIGIGMAFVSIFINLVGLFTD